MSRFHVKNDGKPGKCTAQPGKCPLGGAHFNSKSEALAYAEKMNEAEAAKDVEAEAARDIEPNTLVKCSPEEEKKFKDWVERSLRDGHKRAGMANLALLEKERPEIVSELKSLHEASFERLEFERVGRDGYRAICYGMNLPKQGIKVSRRWGKTVVSMDLPRNPVYVKDDEYTMSELTSRYSDDLKNVVGCLDGVDEVRIGRIQDFLEPSGPSPYSKEYQPGSNLTYSNGAYIASSFEVAPNGTVFHRSTFHSPDDPNIPHDHRGNWHSEPPVLVYADDDTNLDHLYDDSFEFHGEVPGDYKEQLSGFYNSREYKFDREFVANSRKNGLLKLIKEKMAKGPNPEEADFRWAEKRATAFAIGRNGEQILMGLD